MFAASLLLPAVWLVLCTIQFSMTSGQECSNPLGIADGSIPDSNFGASTYQPWHFPYLARLNYHPAKTAGAWCSKENSDVVPRMWVNLPGEYRITKIAIQGRNSSYAGMFTKKFKLYYQDKSSSMSFKQEFSSSSTGEFTGNNDKESIVEHSVDFVASTVSVLPTQFYPTKMACLRIELYGCPAIVLQDECALGTDSCDNTTTKCRDTKDSYVCDCLQSGYKNNPSNPKTCIDIDECSISNGNCSQKCHNTPGSYYCSCHSGYKLGMDKLQCKDINECDTNNGGCSEFCNNTPGSYYCSCKPGFEVGTDRKICQDKDECAINKGGCDQICVNTVGSFFCKCRSGFLLDADKKTCNDINECNIDNGGCNQTCNNVDGSFTCSCKRGYKTVGLECIDIDECLTSPCQTRCVNQIGSYKCECDAGFRLAADKHNCKDIDECAEKTAICPVNTECLNKIGTYECPCLPGYKKDAQGKCVSSFCRALSNLANGYVTPARCLQTDANRINDVCRYKCNTGYELTQSSTRSSICNNDGNWNFQSGSAPKCQPLHCSTVKPVQFGTILPVTCLSTGPAVNTNCQLYCNGGHTLLGASESKCSTNGQLSNDLSLSECVPDAFVKCPADVTVSLPTGAKTIVLQMPRFETNSTSQYVTTIPADSLKGTYHYPVGRTIVKITAANKAGHSSYCTFAVDVIDREAPTVSNCTNENYYVTIVGNQGVVSWPEPIFSDNIQVKAKTQNLKNHVIRPAQVYFVSYTASDNNGNLASCKFFVHVRAKFCSKDRLPGGDGGQLFSTSGSATSMTVFINCPALKTLSFNSNAFNYVCKNGDWTPTVAPDCVGFEAAQTPCPDRTRSVTIYSQTKCVNCPKGTKYNSVTKDCDNCPLGYYQDQEKSAACIKCPNGTVTINTGAKGKLQCLAQCNPGSYSLDGLNVGNSCQTCPLGFYQENYGQHQCNKCPLEGVTLATGSKAITDCIVPAKITKLIPVEELAVADVGGTITIDCYASGIPTPYVYINNATVLAPASFRGTAKRTPLTTSDKHTAGLRLQITNAQIDDNGSFKCIADNRQSTSGARDERVVRVEVNNNIV